MFVCVCVGGGGGLLRRAAKFYVLETAQGLEIMSIMIEVCNYLIHDFCGKNGRHFESL